MSDALALDEHEASSEIIPLSEVSFPSARGGRKPSVPVQVEVVRELCSNDLPALRAGLPVGAEPPAILRIRHSHHQLARLIALGTPLQEVGLLTGYSPSYISTIQRDPQFADLVQGYVAERERAFVDVLERMRTLGLSSLDELQHRLEVEPDKWTRRELMEMADLLIVKPMTSKQAQVAPQGQYAGPSVIVNVGFVKAPTAHVTIELPQTEELD